MVCTQNKGPMNTWTFSRYLGFHFVYVAGVRTDDWPDHHGPDLQPHVRRLRYTHQV